MGSYQSGQMDLCWIQIHSGSGCNIGGLTTFTGSNPATPQTKIKILIGVVNKLGVITQTTSPTWIFIKGRFPERPNGVKILNL